MDLKAEEFRKFIELEVLDIIKKLADEGATPRERIQEIAKKTIELVHPGLSLQEMYQGAVQLDDQYSELAPVVYKVMKEYEEKYERKTLDSVESLIKSGQFDQATDMVKKVLQFKVQP